MQLKYLEFANPQQPALFIIFIIIKVVKRHDFSIAELEKRVLLCWI